MGQRGLKKREQKVHAEKEREEPHQCRRCQSLKVHQEWNMRRIEGWDVTRQCGATKIKLEKKSNEVALPGG